MFRNTQYTILRSCVQATHAPTTHDDVSTGLLVGLQWQDNSVSPPVRYVCLDQTAGAAVWQAIGSGSGSGGVDSVNTRTGAVVLTATDLPTFGPSGTGHSPGAVPDPGATPRSSRYLREDATWAIPSGSGGATITAGDLQVVYGDGSGNGLGDTGILAAPGTGLQVNNTYTYGMQTLGGYWATLGVDVSNSLNLTGTDSTGSSKLLLAVAMDTDTPSATWHVPVVAGGGTPGFTFNDRDGRDPAWTWYANNGAAFLDAAANPGNHAIKVASDGSVVLGGVITSTGAIPATDAAYDLGVETTQRWNNGWFAGIIKADTGVSAQAVETYQVVLQEQDLSPANDQVLDFYTGAYVTIPLTTATTIDATGLFTGQSGVLVISQPASGSPCLVTWAGITWPGGIAPQVTQTLGAVDLVFLTVINSIVYGQIVHATGLFDAWQLPVFKASGTNHAAGAVPDPGASAGTTKFLREDATWALPPAAPVSSVNTRTGAITLTGTDIPVFVASGSSAAAGAVPTPPGSAGTTKFLREDATWALPPSAPVASVNTRTGAITLVATDIPVFIGSGASHAVGTVPDPGTSAGTTKFLREDASWAVPSGLVTSINTRTGAVTLVATDIPVFVASGASHATGTVPDPGASAGTTKFLREDATWALPTGFANPMTTVGDVIYGGTSGAPTRLAGNTSNITWVFTSTGTGILTTPPTWQAITASMIPALPASVITSGTLGTAQGGTGLDSSSAANGAIPIGTGAGLALSTITAGTGVSVTNGAGTITLANTGVTAVNTRTGAITLTGTDIPVFVASGSSAAAGAVPAPSGTAGTTHFLREDATWAVPAGSPGLSFQSYASSGFTISSTTQYVEYSGPGGGSGTLPAASALAPFAVAVIIKNKSTGPLIMFTAGTGPDTIEDGMDTSIVIPTGGSYYFISNASNTWSLN